MREKNPTFSLNFQVFSADSLEKADNDLRAPDMFERLNSRMQLSASSRDRYLQLIGKKFDLVCGNPPWGGVLKGSLAPVFEERKKQRFKLEYPNTATGKYDIYGLFFERAVQLLNDGGHFAMITQDTYFDKEWAVGLRQMLANKTNIKFIIDLNPFGQLFFNAMNTPAVTVFQKNNPSNSNFAAIVSRRTNLKGVPSNQRRGYVIETIATCLQQLIGHKRKVEVDFVIGNKLSHEMLKENAAKRWNLESREDIPELKNGWYSAAEIFEPRQGVTPGGCLEVFLMSEQQSTLLKLEDELIHRSIKTRETNRWHIVWQNRILLYPYIKTESGSVTAFKIVHDRVDDILDFENSLDDEEKEIKRDHALDNLTARNILEHRIALGLVKYPQTARYLVGYYSRLSGRIFKKRRLETFGRQWYEYLWPRDPILMLTNNRIISPSLAKEPRFALDTEGFLADHSCQYLMLTKETAKQREIFRMAFSKILARKASDIDILRYCLAFLNSPYSFRALTSGHRPTPKGSYQINEKYLKEIPVVLPQSKEQAEIILCLVDELVSGVTASKQQESQAKLSQFVMNLINNK
jgi:hypothetical protein